MDTDFEEHTYRAATRIPWFYGDVSGEAVPSRCAEYQTQLAGRKIHYRDSRENIARFSSLSIDACVQQLRNNGHRHLVKTRRARVPSNRSALFTRRRDVVVEIVFHAATTTVATPLPIILSSVRAMSMSASTDGKRSSRSTPGRFGTLAHPGPRGVSPK